MSTSVQAVLLKDIQQLNLGQWLSPTQTDLNKALPLKFTEQVFLLDSQIACSNSHVNEAVLKQQEPLSDLELIVFSDINVAVFTALIDSCQLELVALNAINQRNNAISYRFLIQCSDVAKARQQLVAFNIQHQIESAIMLEAPRLTTPGLLVMDMDSTTIEIECIDEIARLAGVGEEVAAVTELAMLGELDFRQSLHQRVAKLNGAPESILAAVAKDIPLMPGLETLVSQLKAHQWRIAIASGGFTYFADHLHAMLDLDASAANVLEIKDEKLTGKVLGEVIDAQAKADCLAKLQTKFAIDSKQTVAMGDGANDLVMMATAHLGVAYHAKPLVLAQADTSISQANSGLDCLLHWLS